jgi:hypothetical protein
MFDINKMLATTFEDANSTQATPVPEGEYIGRVEKIDFRVITTRNNEERPILRVSWIPEDGDGRIKEATGRDRSIVSQDIWLDMTPEGNLDMGKGMNVSLGRLREIFHQNTPGKPWGFNQLIGNVAKVLVTHRQDDKGNVFAEVKNTAAI